MFLASLLGLLGMAAHESYTTTPEYLRRKNPEYFTRMDGYKASIKEAEARAIRQKETSDKRMNEIFREIEEQRKQRDK